MTTEKNQMKTVKEQNNAPIGLGDGFHIKSRVYFRVRVVFLAFYILGLGALCHRYLPSSLPAVPILRILISPK